MRTLLTFFIAAAAGTAQIGITIEPAEVTFSVDGTQQFAAIVTETENPDVIWEIVGSSPADPLMPKGTLDANGLYTAPHELWADYPVTIQATSVADPTKKATATIHLAKPPIPSSIVVTMDVDGVIFRRALSPQAIYAMMQHIRNSKETDILLDGDGNVVFDSEGKTLIGKKYRNIPEVVMRHSIETLIAPLLKKYPTPDIQAAKDAAEKAKKDLDDAVMNSSSRPAL